MNTNIVNTYKHYYNMAYTLSGLTIINRPTIIISKVVSTLQHVNKKCLTKQGVMYYISIKRYNLEYTKSEKTRELDQSL